MAKCSSGSHTPQLPGYGRWQTFTGDSASAFRFMLLQLQKKSVVLSSSADSHYNSCLHRCWHLWQYWRLSGAANFSDWDANSSKKELCSQPPDDFCESHIQSSLL
ncbi:hypothetical protein GDO78_000908 [Eleutherodactylus coqui]|uniref:Uncharacterized protein n=1 Tax=Eleutherodactylus coqui TaxID=57060 RepID=A0A8J6KG57_ELECQ|nr:hypothetical protein GDO78_000908 [Eleutherodactylus coqui]